MMFIILNHITSCLYNIYIKKVSKLILSFHITFKLTDLKNKFE